VATFTFEKRPDEPILVFTAHDDYIVVRDIPDTEQHAQAHLDALEAPVFYINDFTRVRYNMDDVLAVGGVTRSQETTLRHPNVREVILVVRMDRMTMAVIAGLSNKAFGSFVPKVFGTMAEALDYAREQYTVPD
jgi:hypothetical protein